MSEKNKELREALFGATIEETLSLCKVGFDKHFGTINIIHFDEHETPREASTDRTPDFIHALEQWFKFFSMKNKTPTLKIEKAKGEGFVIAIIPIIMHKTKENWFTFYMEKDGWRQTTGYWKNGMKFDVITEGKIIVTKNVGLPGESTITINAPMDDLQVKVMLELVK